MYGLLKCVKKRSGNIQDFDIGKLQKTILVTIQEENEFNEPLSVAKAATSKMSFEIVDAIEKLVKAGKCDNNSIDVDIIQDSVETVFYSNGYHDTAKNYMRYKYNKQLSKKDDEIKKLKEELQAYKNKCNDDGK